MKRALVTGGSGFLGSYLVARLLQEGIAVGIIHRPDSELSRLSRNLPRVQCFAADLLDRAAVGRALREFAPDTVFHLAWRGVLGRCRNDFQQIETNLQASVALAQQATEFGCETIVGAGSQAEYGPQQHPVDERVVTRPTTLYGACKLSTYFLLDRICELANARFVWLRIFSLYGPADSPEWLLPGLIRTLLRGERPALTAGEQLWDFLHVEDAADAFYRAAVTREARGAYNLGSGEAQRLKDLIEWTRNQIDPSLELGFGEVPYRPDQVMVLQAITKRFEQATGWKPRIPMEEGLLSMITEMRRGRAGAGPL